MGVMLWAMPAPPQEVQFTDVAAPAGIRFRHNPGKTGRKWLPETMGSGCAFFDADNDGWLDILLINGKDWKPRGRNSLPGFYRNNKDGTFTDITARSGLDIEGYGMAIAADKGRAIRGRRIDLFFHSRQAALQFGRRHVRVHVLTSGE